MATIFHDRIARTREQLAHMPEQCTHVARERERRELEPGRVLPGSHSDDELFKVFRHQGMGMDWAEEHGCREITEHSARALDDEYMTKICGGIWISYLRRLPSRYRTRSARVTYHLKLFETRMKHPFLNA